ncbi:hypothetical protein NPIL_263211 [Nephila pilipes]|uniref:Uncharacterized protein n=1 Tax=Nephila pilipes TaxID=299642 RepID=A0A8X6QVT9_NEPPI|nr:hypothetical protein NPIL_263211 [Nephila pilipes]
MRSQNGRNSFWHLMLKVIWIGVIHYGSGFERTNDVFGRVEGCVLKSLIFPIKNGRAKMVPRDGSFESFLLVDERMEMLTRSDWTGVGYILSLFSVFRAYLGIRSNGFYHAPSCDLNFDVCPFAF